MLVMFVCDELLWDYGDNSMSWLSYNNAFARISQAPTWCFNKIYSDETFEPKRFFYPMFIGTHFDGLVWRFRILWI